MHIRLDTYVASFASEREPSSFVGHVIVHLYPHPLSLDHYYSSYFYDRYASRVLWASAIPPIAVKPRTRRQTWIEPFTPLPFFLSVFVLSLSECVINKQKRLDLRSKCVNCRPTWHPCCCNGYSGINKGFTGVLLQAWCSDGSPRFAKDRSGLTSTTLTAVATKMLSMDSKCIAFLPLLIRPEAN